ncbi:response regulator [Massilia antarctica]|uniref:response regulator n=1 Tax=Massilia antarctica TaxID=2765360 RepID=UPI00226D7196|nr:response regulator [Massilia sp. H27-R4]MCY0916332.1 response regulator [Massilia sp. H27-R4]
MKNFQFKQALHSISLRAPALMMTSVLLTTILVSVISLALTKDTIRLLLQDEQLARIESIAQGIDGKFASRRVTLQILAESIPKQLIGNPVALQEYLTNLPSLKSAFDTVAILDIDGNLIANLNSAKPIGKLNIRDREYFIRTIQNNTGVISKPYRNRYSNLPQVAVTQPVKGADNKLAYVISGAINLHEDNFLGEFSKVSFGRSGYLFILNSDGTLIDHPDKKRILTLVNGPGHSTAPVTKALAGFEGTMVATSSYGVEGLYVYKRIQATDWILGGIYPTAEAFQSIDGLRRRAVVYAILLALGMGMLAAIIMRAQLHPLRLLQETMRMDAETPLRKIQPIKFSRDEFGEIARAYYAARHASYSLSEQVYRNEKHLRDILTHAGDAFVGLDAAGLIVEWNRQAEKTFGWLRDEVIGKPLEDILIPTAFRRRHAEGIARFARCGTGEVIDKLIELTALHRDGHCIAVELSVAASFNGTDYVASAFLRDITTRKESEQKIYSNEKFLRTITDNIPILIGYAGVDERYQFANAAYKNFLGIDPDSIVGKTMREVLGEKSYSEIEPYLKIVKSGHSAHFERAVAVGDRSVHFMGDYIPDIGNDGRVNGLFILVIDISARKDAEIAQEKSQAIAEAASRAKSEFVANMSHELRTPMNAVLGVTQLLAKSSLTPEQRRDIGIIRTAGQSLLGILNNILDFSKLEAGKVEVSIAPFRLDDVLRNLAAIMSINASAADLELIIGVEPGVPDYLMGDALRLEQILVNLTGNAIKFTSRGEVSVLIDQIGCGGGIFQLHFSVRDTGIGISAEQQTRLFSPFSQADSSTTRRYGGTGLGLVISKSLIELQGGHIELHSTPGTGSQFDFTIPFALVESTSEPPRRTNRLGQLRLLVVDDNPTSLAYLEKMIRSWQWDVDLVTSGAEALAMIRKRHEQGSTYDMVLADWHMPGMDGVATMEAIHLLTESSTVPVIIMVNASGRAQLNQENSSATPLMTLIKPITASILFDTVLEARGKEHDMLPEPTSTMRDKRLAAHILLVEDNDINQFVATSLLQDAGATVDVVDNGQAAIDLLRAKPKAFDLILMDVQMPIMDGFTATRLIRSELRLTLPILAMTAGVMEDERAQCIAAGMNDFIGKPIDIDQVLVTIVRHLPAKQFISSSTA